MINWSFAASLMVILAGIGVVVLAAWLGWGNWQRNGRRGKVALLEVIRFVAVAMLAFTLLQPEYIRLIKRTDPPQVVILTDASGSLQPRDVAVERAQGHARRLRHILGPVKLVVAQEGEQGKQSIAAAHGFYVPRRRAGCKATAKKLSGALGTWAETISNS